MYVCSFLSRHIAFVVSFVLVLFDSFFPCRSLFASFALCVFRCFVLSFFLSDWGQCRCLFDGGDGDA